MAKNLILCRDKHNNFFRIPNNDPRYLNGEIIAISKGFVNTKDFNGNIIRTSVNDPRYLSGELVHTSCGLIDVLYNNEIFKCKPNDPNVINGSGTKLNFL